MKASASVYWAGMIACASILVLPAATKPGILWETKNFDASRMDLNGVASDGSGRLVAVGAVGAIRVSDDHGTSWTNRDANVSYDLNAVGWTGSQWIAVGGHYNDTCVILTSPDGTDWTTTCLADGMFALHGVASGASTSVAAGRHGLVARSDDLVAWHTQTDGTYTFADVVWTGGQFVAVGDHGLVKTSPDGATWTLRTNGLANNLYLNSVAWNGTLLVAGGEDFSTGAPLILTSADGIDWAAPSMAGVPDFHIEAVEWTGSAFVAMGENGHTLVSTDGTVWSHHLAPDGIDVHGLCRDGSHLVAVGRGGAVIDTAESIPDEESDWTVRMVAGNTHNFYDVAQGEVSGADRAVAVGTSGAILTSDDQFETITPQTSGTGYTFFGITSTSVPTIRFISVGVHGTILVSPDAATWTSKTSAVVKDLRSIDWFKPFGIASSFAITVGDDGTILTSTDASTWTPQSSHTAEDLNGVAVGVVYVKPIGLVKRIVAVGDNSTILYSSDGTTWKAANAPGITEDLDAVAALERGFIAVGDRGAILTSSNGIDWTTQTNGSTLSLRDVVWTGDQIVAVGISAAIFTSPDGIQWTRRHGPGSTHLNGAAKLDSGRLVVSGVQGWIAVSDPAPDFGDWIAAQSPPPGQDGPDDDPNGDGVTNLLAYGLDIPAVAPATAEDLAALPLLVQPAPMIVRIRVPERGLPDLAYIVETSETLEPGAWTEVLCYLPGQLCGTGSLQVRMSSASTYVSLVFPENIGDRHRYFTRLRVELTP